MSEELNLGPPIPHAGSLTTTDGNVISSSAAAYTTTGTGGQAFTSSGTSAACPRYVEVFNLDSAINVYVNVGNSLEIPPAPTAGSAVVFPGTSRVFRVPGSKAAKGVAGYLKHVAASGNPNRAFCWYW